MEDKEKFIQKLLEKHFDKELFEISNFTIERNLINDALKYKNFNSCVNWFLVGLTIGICLTHFILNY